MEKPGNGFASGGKGRFNRTSLIVAGVLILLALVAVLVQLNQDAFRQTDALASANTDSTQWSLAQSDIEILSLITAIQAAEARPDGDLSDVRKRFDVFYSRARILSDSPLLDTLREDPKVLEGLNNIELFLKDAVPFIDGDDESLRAVLPSLRQRSQAARNDVREINFKGIRVLSIEADTQRSSIARTLRQVSTLTFVLFTVLVVAACLLAYFFLRAQQRAEDQSQMRSHLGAMVSTSLDAVIAVDASGKLIEYNGAAEDIFGYTREEAMGQQMEDLFIPDHMKEGHKLGMERYRTTREKHVIGKGRIQLEARRKNGDVFPVELSIETAMSDGGEIFVSFLRDISRRLAAEQELIKARDEAVAGERAKADLIAVMSHEMRTPLNGMLGTLELIDSEKQSEKHHEYVEIIRASGRLLLHHVDNVLEISRAEAGKIEIEETSFSVSAMVRELVESQRSVSEHRGNSISQIVQMHGDDCAIGDPTRLRQVLLNLIGNAIKFTSNGSITVEARRLAGDECNQIEFRVTDTGIGVPKEARERIFDDFVTLDPSYSRAVGGTGLGLAIVRRLVEVMGGEVGLESSTGYGSSFWVRLPLPVANNAVADEKDKSDLSIASTQCPAVAPLKILVVEDNQINRTVVRDLLVKDGHRVTEAFDGRSGVERALDDNFDLVLMDISMPIMDGVQATRQIRASEPPNTHLPIIALTAHAVPAERERFIAAGLDDVVIKPITRQSLRETLAAHSNGPRQTKLEVDGPNDSSFYATVDHLHLRELTSSLGSEKIQNLITEFLRECDEGISEIAEKISEGENGDELRKQVHHLAGSSAIVGAEALRAALVDVETNMVEGKITTALDSETVTTLLSRTEKELKLHLTNVLNPTLIKAAQK